MSKAAKIAISLPTEVLKTVEEERARSGESRSEFFRRAVEALLRRRREYDLSRQYLRAYQQQPETGVEVEAARWAANSILAA